MDKNNFREYLSFLRELSATLTEIVAVEQEKTQFVRDDDLDGLNECMKREQALSMTLRSYDQKRDGFLTALGLEDVPLRGLTAAAPADCRDETKQTVEDLCREYAQFRGAFGTAQNTLECNLHQVEKLLQSGASGGSEGPGYEGAEPQMPSNFRTDFRA